MARPTSRPARLKQTTSSKDGYHHGDLRRGLIDAALTLVAEGNIADLSLREVARRAGVTYAAPYHHFADKSALLAAVARQGFEELISELERAALRRTSLKSQLLAMSEAYVAFAMGHAAHYRVMFLSDVKNSPDADELHVAADRAFALLQDRVALAKSSESERVHQTLATTIWAALHGLSLLAIDGLLQNRHPDMQKLIRSACRLIVAMATASN